MRVKTWMRVAAASLLAASLFVVASLPGIAQDGQPIGWENVPSILAEIQSPTFPDRDFPLIKFGAVAGGETDCKPALDEAIEACQEAGGGRVVVPPGKWLVRGPIHLKSNVNLHVSEGATILFSADPADFLPNVFTRFEGTELLNYSPLIYAYEQENIAITGGGVLDGQASEENWWRWKQSGNDDVARLVAMAEAGTPAN
jgi:polygalacturonase